jgi:hypothetical protein
MQRPAALVVALRAAQTYPSSGVAIRDGEALRVDKIGRDERTASTSLHDARVNVLQSVLGKPGAWLAIEKGGLGWRAMTTDAQLVDVDAMRAINAAIAELRPVMAAIVGSRPAANADHTIAEEDAKKFDLRVNGTWRRALGLEAPSPYNKPQASDGAASVDRGSIVGAAPYELAVEYTVDRLGFVSNVRGTVRVGGGL